MIIILILAIIVMVQVTVHQIVMWIIERRKQRAEKNNARAEASTKVGRKLTVCYLENINR